MSQACFPDYSDYPSKCTEVDEKGNFVNFDPSCFQCKLEFDLRMIQLTLKK